MKPFDLQCDPALREAARALDDSPEYRILRRLPHMEELWLMPTPVGGPDIRLGIVDTETTGLGDDAKIIEIAVMELALVDGQLANITPPASMMEDPGEPLSSDITRITGISDEMVHGQRFDENLLAGQLDQFDALVAFNAKFDAGHLRRRFPWLMHPWICAREDFDWAKAGYSGRSQQALVEECGHFYPPHRAAADIWALAMLIGMPAGDGRAIAAHMVDNARRTEFRVSAFNAPFAVKDQLKAAGVPLVGRQAGLGKARRLRRGGRRGRIPRAAQHADRAGCDRDRLVRSPHLLIDGGGDASAAAIIIDTINSNGRGARQPTAIAASHACARERRECI